MRAEQALNNFYNHYGELLPLLLPFMMCLLYSSISSSYALKKINIKTFTKYYVLLIPVLSFLSSLMLSSSKTLFVHIAISIGSTFMASVICFIMMEYSYELKLFSGIEMLNKFYSPQKVDKISYYDNSYGIFFVSLLFRYSLPIAASLYLASILIAQIFFDGRKNEFCMLLIYMGTFSAFIFFFTISYLRLLFKCTECDIPFYKFYHDFNKYVVMSKKAVKEGVLECVHCDATYVLWKSINLDDVRNNLKSKSEDTRIQQLK